MVLKRSMGGADVLTVGTLLHQLQLTHTRHVRQARLNLCHVWHLDRSTGRRGSGAGVNNKSRV